MKSPEEESLRDEDPPECVCVPPGGPQTLHRPWFLHTLATQDSTQHENGDVRGSGGGGVILDELGHGSSTQLGHR